MFEDRRTAAERDRDLKRNEKIEQERLLSLNFLHLIRNVLCDAEGLELGLVGRGNYSGAEMLVESNGVTYRMKMEVDQS